MPRQFSYDDLMALRRLGAVGNYTGSGGETPEQQMYSLSEDASPEDQQSDAYVSAIYDLINKQNQPISPVKELMNRAPASQPPQSRQQELETMVGRGAPIGADAGMLDGQVEPSEQKMASRAPASIPAAPKEAEIPSLNELNFGKNDLASQQGLQQAIQDRNDRQMIANIAAAANTFSGGLAKTGPVDNTAFDKLSKQAEQSVTDYEKKVEFQKQDPNSAYSKGLRDYFKTKLGMEVRGDASAAELEKIMPFAVREFEAKEERAARKEQRDLDRKQRAEDKAEDRKLRETLAGISAGKKEDAAKGKAKDKLDTNTRLIRKEIFSGPSGKAYTNYQNADRAARSIEKFMANPTGYSDYATLLGGLKALQGDESVVRETEIRLGMDAGSFKDKILNRVEKLKSGKSLQKGQREAILKAVEVLRDVTKSQFLQASAPQLRQAEEMGIPRDHLINDLLDRKPDSELIKVRDKATGRVKGFSKADANKLLSNPDKFEPVQ